MLQESLILWSRKKKMMTSLWVSLRTKLIWWSRCSSHKIKMKWFSFCWCDYRQLKKLSPLLNSLSDMNEITANKCPKTSREKMLTCGKWLTKNAVLFLKKFKIKCIPLLKWLSKIAYRPKMISLTHKKSLYQPSEHLENWQINIKRHLKRKGNKP